MDSKQSSISSVVVTGANAGIGHELARQLGDRPEITRIVLGCRDPQRGADAVAALAERTGRSIYELLVLDVADLASVRAAATALDGPVDALVMNAGGTGGRTPLALTDGGATEIFAVNVLGHAALLEALVGQGKLTTAAVYVGSEGARGVPRLRMARPDLALDDPDALAAVIDGRHYAGVPASAAGSAAYADAKLVAALWMGAVARRHRGLRLVTMSPGGTRGTRLSGGMPPLMGFVYDHIVMGMVARRITHTVEVGAGRLLDAVVDPTLDGGRFFASAEDTLTGPVLDQAAILPALADPRCQDAAAAAVERFLTSVTPVAG